MCSQKECIATALVDTSTCSRSFEQHVKHTKIVMQRLRAAGMKIKAAKSTLLAKSLMYVGAVVSGTGVATDPAKVHAALD